MPAVREESNNLCFPLCVKFLSDLRFAPKIGREMNHLREMECTTFAAAEVFPHEEKVVLVSPLQIKDELSIANLFPSSGGLRRRHQV
jgi:hypothetical protein